MAQKTRHLSIEWLNVKSKSSMDYPLIVNTTGYCDVPYSFETYNPVGRDDYYLIYITEGELTLDIDGRKCTVKRGSSIVFPPKYMYAVSNSSKVNAAIAPDFTALLLLVSTARSNFEKCPASITSPFSFLVSFSF